MPCQYLFDWFQYFQMLLDLSIYMKLFTLIMSKSVSFFAFIEYKADLYARIKKRLCIRNVGFVKCKDCSQIAPVITSILTAYVAS